MGVVQVPGAHHHELGHHVSLPGHRDGRDVAQEQHILALEVQLGKRIGGEGGGQDL